jgi:uncharacterized protein with LGFP repeats
MTNFEKAAASQGMDAAHTQHQVQLALPVNQIRQHEAALGGAPGTAISSLEDIGSGWRIRYQNGAIYLGPSTPPAWVHGAIEGRYNGFAAAAGWLGMPITDETGAPDGRGRYNHFEQGSIYWTATTGAFEVHGAIRDRWAALGWERSSLGYPLSDETAIPGSAGRFNTFEGGSINWTPAAGAFMVAGGALPTTITAHADISFPDSTPVGGTADIVLGNDGGFTISGHLHDSSGLADYSDSVVYMVIAQATKTAYTFLHSGTVHGQILPGPSNDDWNESGNRQELVAAWPDLCAGYDTSITAHVDWDTAGLVDLVKQAYPYVVAVVSLL